MPRANFSPGRRLRLDLAEERLWDGNKIVALRRKPFTLLRYLVQNPHRLLTKQDILKHVWPDTWVTEGSIKGYVKDLRKALGDDSRKPRVVETVRGRGYRYLGGIEVQTVPGREDSRASYQDAPPAVFVLPFQNLGDPRDRNDVAKCITEDIKTELSRFCSLSVIARVATGVRFKSFDSGAIGRLLGVEYLLIGSVRRANDRVRVTAQLVEATTGNLLWAEHFDRDWNIALDLHDEISGAIAVIVAKRIAANARSQVAGKPPKALNAYDYILFGESIVANSRTSNQAAQKAYKRALELAPDSAAAMAGLAHSHALDGVFGFEPDYESSLDEALSHAARAANRGNAGSKSEWVLGHIYANRREFDRAGWHFARALELNPLDADAHRFRGLYLTLVGSPELGIACYQTAMRLNPFYPASYNWNLASTYYAARQYDQGLVSMKLFCDRYPSFMRPRRTLAATYAQMRRSEEAQQTVEQILAFEPGANLRGEQALLSRRFKDNRDVDHWLDGLRKAGFPE